MSKQVKNHGLKAKEFELTDDALTGIIRTYTREAGVRSLEREIAKVARKSLTKIVKKEAEEVTVTGDNLDEFLGVPKFRYGLAEKEDQIGVVTGLAYTSVGGELLSIEALRLPGKGRMKTTGKLGDVMKESIEAASSYVRSVSPELGIKPPKFDKVDIHVHVPEGATPKDGPSAGLAMVTSIVSVLTGIPSAQGHRHDWRGHAARQCTADWRVEGETAGGAAGRYQNRADPGRKRKGPARDSGQRERRSGNHHRQPCVRGAETRC